jgi:hypothetical protein
MNFNKINESKIIKIFINCALCLIMLFLIATFAQFYSIKLNFTNPLIPESLVKIFLEPYLIKGIILTTGIIGVFTLKYFKYNLLALILSIILIVYYIFSNHYVSGWNTQI